MDTLHTDGVAPDSHSLLPANLPLGLSSGNAQSLVVDCGEGIENQIPSLKQEPQYLIPVVRLGSNDHRSHEADGEIQVLKPREHRPKALFDPRRPFLQDAKYIQYMGRQRQEFGQDGKPIWSDEVEAAFQDALMHIPPMGRKKCSQRGKPHGRNMLIAEWIFRATGEMRERKQVSSHIQVLDRFLKGIPEWEVLLRPEKVGAGSNEGRKYYHNSIEHMVKQHKATAGFAQRRRVQHSGSLSTDTGDCWDNDSLSTLPDSLDLHQINFEMWVSFPDQPEQALHKYTTLQTVGYGSLQMPLEDLPDWRLSFPRLQNSLDASPGSSQCEIVLVNASFRLMDSFPPRGSKLGIGLELEFGTQEKETSMFRAANQHFKDWTSATFMYQDGELLQDPVYEKCNVSSGGQIRPVFQSRWWASTFTSLTETKKLAEDSKDRVLLQAAEQRIHAFFQSLSIMQEVWAVQSGANGTLLPKKMAILLWKFSQAPSGFTGTSTWQKLLAPPDRFTTNSPLPHGSELDLPPLAMDTLIEGSPLHGNLDRNDPFPNSSHLPYDFYQTPIDDELCMNGFMDFKADHVASLSHLVPAFDRPAGEGLGFELDDFSDPYVVGLKGNNIVSQPLTGPQLEHTLERNFQNPQSMDVDAVSSISHNLFDHERKVLHSSSKSQGHALDRFDPKYHQVLQKQLGAKALDTKQQGSCEAEGFPSASEMHYSQSLAKAEEYTEDHTQYVREACNPLVDEHGLWTQIEDQDEALRSALLAASAINDHNTGKSPIIPQTPIQGQRGFLALQQPQTPHWDSPLAFRPFFQGDQSFSLSEQCEKSQDGLEHSPHPLDHTGDDQYLQAIPNGIINPHPVVSDVELPCSEHVCPDPPRREESPERARARENEDVSRRPMILEPQEELHSGTCRFNFSVDPASGAKLTCGPGNQLVEIKKEYIDTKRIAMP